MNKNIENKATNIYLNISGFKNLYYMALPGSIASNITDLRPAITKPGVKNDVIDNIIVVTTSLISKSIKLLTVPLFSFLFSIIKLSPYFLFGVTKFNC